MIRRKGIILAGGKGTRLYPLTKVISKQLLPVYDKPMIYYPLSTLMQANIRDILIISTPEDITNFKNLLGDGSLIGLKLSYEVQENPNGLAEAFIIGESFLDGCPSALILGDNLFFGSSLDLLLQKASKKKSATIFGCKVNDPNRYGIAEFNDEGKVVNIEEKPKKPKSSYAITGLYFFDEKAPYYAKKLSPSKEVSLK